VVTIPLAPRTARAIDLAISERTSGPVFLAADGRRVDRHGGGSSARPRAAPGSPRPSRPTRCGTFSLLCFHVAIAVIGVQADLRPALFDYLLLAAACCGTM